MDYFLTFILFIMLILSVFFYLYKIESRNYTYMILKKDDEEFYKKKRLFLDSRESELEKFDKETTESNTGSTIESNTGSTTESTRESNTGSTTESITENNGNSNESNESILKPKIEINEKNNERNNKTNENVNYDVEKDSETLENESTDDTNIISETLDLNDGKNKKSIKGHKKQKNVVPDENTSKDKN